MPEPDPTPEVEPDPESTGVNEEPMLEEPPLED